MKSGWERKQIGELCEVVNGGTPKTTISEYWGGKNLWITPAEMGKRSTPYVEDTERKITDAGLANSSARILPKNSVVLSSRAPIGHLIINSHPMATNQGCKGLVPKKYINYKFLYYYLLSIVDILDSLGTGATFKELSGGKLKEIFISYPDIFNQRRIVAILDEAFADIAAAKEKAEQNLKNAKEVFDSSQKRIFSMLEEENECKTLGILAEFRNGVNFTKNSKGETVKIVGVKDFKDNFFVPDQNIDSVVMDGKLNEIDLLRNNDILTVRSNGNQELIGRCMIACNVHEKTTHSGFTIRIRSKSNSIFPLYLCAYLRSDTVRKQLVGEGTGINIKSLNQKSLSSLVVPLPNQSEQRQIVAQLDNLSAETSLLESLYQQKLSDLEELKKSVLQQAFSGAL